MRVLSPLLRKKRGISEIVSYALLISITIALSVIVYGWLRFYVSGDDIETCSEDVNIIISSYECQAAEGNSGGNLMVVLKNKGLFTVDGYELRVHTRPGADFAIYLLENKTGKILPGGSYTAYYDFDDPKNNVDLDGDGSMDDKLNKVSLVEVQSFILSDTDSNKIRCKSYASQVVDCK